MKAKLITLLPVAIILFVCTSYANAMSQGINVCDLYGQVFIESDPNYADYLVYVHDSEAFADLIVYEEDNQLFADRSGLWFYTSDKLFANFTVYFVNDPHQADFTIAYTNAQNFAGCP